MALYNSPDYQTSFKSIGFSVQEKKFNIGFQDGRHLGLPDQMILAIFDLTPSFESAGLSSGEEAQNKFSRWWLWRASLISIQNDFSYFCSTILKIYLAVLLLN